MALDNRTQRLQVTLPKSTVQMIDDFTKAGKFDSRSGFLNQAAKRYAIRLKKAQVKRALKAGYLARAERDKQLSESWDVVSNELLWDVPRNAE